MLGYWIVANVGWACSWGSWSEVTLNNGESAQITYYPGSAGDHKIRFLNDAGTYNAGVMHSSWISNAAPSWHHWATSDVLSSNRTQDLYSGSYDVGFLFEFENLASDGEAHTFYWRFCTD